MSQPDASMTLHVWAFGNFESLLCIWGLQENVTKRFGGCCIWGPKKVRPGLESKSTHQNEMTRSPSPTTSFASCVQREKCKETERGKKRAKNERPRRERCFGELPCCLMHKYVACVSFNKNVKGRKKAKKSAQVSFRS